MLQRAGKARLRMLLAGLALACAAAVAAQDPPPEVASVIAEGSQDAHGVPTYVVTSAEEQELVLQTLGVQPLSQALVFDDDGTAYDVVETSAGTIRFDVTAFIGKEQ